MAKIGRFRAQASKEKAMASEPTHASVALKSASQSELEHVSRISVEAQLQHALVKRALSLSHQHVQKFSELQLAGARLTAGSWSTS